MQRVSTKGIKGLHLPHIDTQLQSLSYTQRSLDKVSTKITKLVWVQHQIEIYTVSTPNFNQIYDEKVNDKTS